MNQSNWPNPPEDPRKEIIDERIRQARFSFNLALLATAVSASISLVGGGLLLSGKLSEGGVTAAGGLFSSACCVRFCKDANDRLDKISDDLNE